MAVDIYEKMVDNFYLSFKALPAEQLLNAYEDAKAAGDRRYDRYGRALPTHEMRTKLAQYEGAKKALLERIGE